MLGYALGRTVHGVRPAADRRDDARPAATRRSPIWRREIVTSRQFRNRARRRRAAVAAAAQAPSADGAAGRPMSIDDRTPRQPSRRHSCAASASRWRCRGWSRCRCFAPERPPRRPRPSTPPLRLGIVYFSNGVEPTHWWAKGSGATMELGPGLTPMMPHREDMVFIQGLFNQTRAGLDQPAPRPHERAVGRAGQPRSRTRSASARRWTRCSPRRSAAAPRSRAWCSASSRTSCGSKTACR